MLQHNTAQLVETSYGFTIVLHTAHAKNIGLLKKLCMSTKKTLGNKLEGIPYEVNIAALHQGETENRGPAANKEKSVCTGSVREIFLAK